MNKLQPLKEAISESLETVFGHTVDPSSLILSTTKKEFEGDFTVVVFPFTKVLRKRPEEIGVALGTWIKNHRPFLITDYSVIKGFLNFTMPDTYWRDVLTYFDERKNHGIGQASRSKVLVEYSSPNTNKPLHLGHIRNILLGWSIHKILLAVGHEVQKTKVVNDRGIAICKSMLAWQLDEERRTPSSSDIKGDHLVGDYYVDFEKRFQSEYQPWQQSEEGQAIYEARLDKGQSSDNFFKSYKNKYFNERSHIGKSARDLLILWEKEDPEVRDLWSMMNEWVYRGWDDTYGQLGVTFDFRDYESETYLLGKDIIQDGLDTGTFYRQDDGSVWVDLEDRGLDKKILLRSDGTSVYITQDLGTAQRRYKDHGAEKMIYVVGDEQDYHFKVLFEALKKLEEPYADGLYHLSYGMVDLPTGRMKGREGTVVDADDLIAEVIEEVRTAAIERGELEELTGKEREDIYRKIGLAALKFFILKVNPKKRMVFDPKESVDMQGQTGPYIQNAYVRIMSMLRRVADGDIGPFQSYDHIDSTEKDLIGSLTNYPDEVAKAAEQYDPSVIANYTYDLAKKFHRFYHDVRVLSAESPEARSFRLVLCRHVADTLSHAMDLLGIEMPTRM